MVESRTSRMGQPQWSAGTPDAPSRADFNEAFLALENLVLVGKQGTLAARPAANDVQAVRSTYHATDTDQLFYSDGATWFEIPVLNGVNGTPPSIFNPPGVLVPFAGSVVPDGWLLCDGTAVSRSTYATLFAAISTAYGVGDGATTFNLPNLKGRVPVGRDAADVTFDVLGETGGSKTHALSESELPAHTHTINHDHASVTSGDAGSHSHTIYVTGSRVEDGGDTMRVNTVGYYNVGGDIDIASYGATDAVGNHNHSVNLPNYTGSSGSVGAGTPHNNVQPFAVVNYLIKT
jgi:microcystin-dependent protein